MFIAYILYVCVYIPAVKGVAGTYNTMSKNKGDDSPILEGTGYYVTLEGSNLTSGISRHAGDETVNTQDLVSDCTTSDANSGIFYIPHVGDIP